VVDLKDIKVDKECNTNYQIGIPRTPNPDLGYYQQPDWQRGVKGIANDNITWTTTTGSSVPYQTMCYSGDTLGLTK
jgi:hypothetical protein